MQPRPLVGAGLGLRRGLLDAIMNAAADGATNPSSSDGPSLPAFLEAAPENWIGVGGRLGRAFDACAERFPLALHGLSLDIGGWRPLDRQLVQSIRTLMDRYGCPLYSEHLTWCADEGHLYELLPLPFTAEMVRHVAARVACVQDLLGRRLALENASYYLTLPGDMDEATFIRAVVEEADCDLLLDVNNIVVNSANHGYDPLAFLDALPLERVRCLHIAGHRVAAPDLLIDTHGSPVGEAAWALLAQAYERCGPLPTLVERDFNYPPLRELLEEVARIAALQRACAVGRVEDGVDG